MPSEAPITCVIRYVIAPGKLKDFEEYGRRWVGLIQKYGGTHHGCFLPQSAPSARHSGHFSFPGLGAVGPDNVAVVLYSFPNLEAYESYRSQAAQDEECKAVTAHFEKTKCFSSYERSFMRRLDVQ
jgi:hypothetical protein